MGAPSVPKPLAMTRTPGTDVVDAQIAALDYAANQRRMRAGTGRQSTFMLQSAAPSAPGVVNTKPKKAPGILTTGTPVGALGLNTRLGQ